MSIRCSPYSTTQATPKAPIFIAKRAHWTVAPVAPLENSTVIGPPLEAVNGDLGEKLRIFSHLFWI